MEKSCNFAIVLRPAAEPSERCSTLELSALAQTRADMA